jgi:hypothetical protein
MEQSLIKRIKTEQNFAVQAYTNFKEIKFGIEPCCYVDFESAALDKYLCDWQNSASNKIIIDSGISGIFIEPLIKVNEAASMSCPETPSNVCTIIDLEALLCKSGTYIHTQYVPLTVWVITHNLGRFPSVTVVDTLNQVVVGDIVYNSPNMLTITFNSAFAGYAYLN